jgi:hypothetical protein
MEARTIDRAASAIAQHRLRIVRLQERAADLARNGDVAAARSERTKLLKLLNELDVMEALRDLGRAA